MGTRLGKMEKSEPLSSSWEEVRENVQDETLNGFILNRVFVPEDLLEEILSFTEPNSILALTRVCKAWKDITVRRSFWKLVFEKQKKDWSQIPEAVKDRPHSWMVFHAACKHDIFSKNYVKNHSGEDQFRNWIIIRNGGNHFTIEAPPTGISPLPFDKQFEGLNDVAFVTSFDWCSKQQKIDLWAAGLTPAVLRTLVPFEFVCSEMVGARFDCGAKWKLHVCFGNTEEIWNEVMEEGSMAPGSGWLKVSVSLQVSENDEKQLNDIRYLIFTHHGKDSQFWAGHYGSKFSRVTVKLNCLPPGSVPPRETPRVQNSPGPENPDSEAEFDDSFDYE